MRINEFLNKWKYLFFIGIFVTSISIAQMVDIIPSTLVLQGDYAWACFPGGIICAKIHKSQFCPVIVDRGIMSCEGMVVRKQQG